MEFRVQYEDSKKIIKLEGDVDFETLKLAIQTEFNLENCDIKIEVYEKDYEEYIETLVLPVTKSKLNVK